MIYDEIWEAMTGRKTPTHTDDEDLDPVGDENVFKCPIGWVLPAYPPITSEDFTQDLISKKELWDVDNPIFFQNQIRIARFLQYYTLYDSLLLFHEPGTGKTSVAIAVMDTLYSDTTHVLNRTVFIGNNATIVNNIRQEVKKRSQTCRDMYTTLVQHIQNPDKRESKWQTVWSRLRIDFVTYYQFAKELGSTDMSILQTRYKDTLFIMDECHHLTFHSLNTRGAEIYRTIHDFLHRVERKRLLLMSGTPIHDQPQEISYLLNLMLPLNAQIPTGLDFVREYFTVADRIPVVGASEDDEDDESQASVSDESPDTPSEASPPVLTLPVYQWKPHARQQLGQLLTGKISFMKQSIDSITIVYKGKIIEPMVSLPLYINDMGDFQAHYYLNAYDTDVDQRHDTERGAQPMYTQSIQATLFVFPDGSWGEQGFQRFCQYTLTESSSSALIRHQSVTLSLKKDMWRRFPQLHIDEMIHVMTDLQSKIRFVKQFSATYGSLLEVFFGREHVLKKAYVYSHLVKGSGVLLLALILKDIFHFEMVTHKPSPSQYSTPKNRFMFINDTVKTPDKDVQDMLTWFNRQENRDGRYCRMVLGTNKTKEGISLFHIQQIHILTPSWNFSDISQAMARGIRARSHIGLDHPTVDIYLHTSGVKDNESGQIDTHTSIDFQRFLRSEIKDRNIALVQRFLSQVSWDCVFEYRHHQERIENIKARDGSRECDYTECVYRCWPWSEKDPDEKMTLVEFRNHFRLDEGNFVEWYSHELNERFTTWIQAFFKKTTHCTFSEMWADLGVETHSVFSFVYFLQNWIRHRRPIISIYGTPLFLQYTEPYFFVCGLPMGASPSPSENIVLISDTINPDAINHITRVDTGFSVLKTMEMTKTFHPHDDLTCCSHVIEVIQRLGSALVSSQADTLDETDTRFLRLCRLVEIIPKTLHDVFFELEVNSFLSSLLDTRHHFVSRIFLVVVYACTVVMKERVSIVWIRDAINNMTAWFESFREHLPLVIGHTLTGDGRVKVSLSFTQQSDIGHWIRDVVSPEQQPQELPAPPTTTMSKPLPHEEMTEDEMGYWIFGNTVGFYAFYKTTPKGKTLYIRNVRNKDLYRTRDRKLIPQGKDCAFFRTGDLLFVYLSLARFLGYDSVESDEILTQTARELPIWNRYCGMPHDEIRQVFQSNESFGQFHRNFYINNDPDHLISREDLMKQLTENELRRLLIFSHLKRKTAGCSTLRNLFEKARLLK